MAQNSNRNTPEMQEIFQIAYTLMEDILFKAKGLNQQKIKTTQGVLAFQSFKVKSTDQSKLTHLYDFYQKIAYSLDVSQKKSNIKPLDTSTFQHIITKKDRNQLSSYLTKQLSIFKDTADALSNQLIAGQQCIQTVKHIGLQILKLQNPSSNLCKQIINQTNGLVKSKSETVKSQHVNQIFNLLSLNQFDKAQAMVNQKIHQTHSKFILEYISEGKAISYAFGHLNNFLNKTYYSYRSGQIVESKEHNSIISYQKMVSQTVIEVQRRLQNLYDFVDKLDGLKLFQPNFQFTTFSQKLQMITIDLFEYIQNFKAVKSSYQSHIASESSLKNTQVLESYLKQAQPSTQIACTNNKQADNKYKSAKNTQEISQLQTKIILQQKLKENQDVIAQLLQKIKILSQQVFNFKQLAEIQTQSCISLKEQNQTEIKRTASQKKNYLKSQKELQEAKSQVSKLNSQLSQSQSKIKQLLRVQSTFRFEQSQNQATIQKLTRQNKELMHKLKKQQRIELQQTSKYQQEEHQEKVKHQLQIYYQKQIQSQLQKLKRYQVQIQKINLNRAQIASKFQQRQNKLNQAHLQNQQLNRTITQIDQQRQSLLSLVQALKHQKTSLALHHQNLTQHSQQTTGSNSQEVFSSQRNQHFVQIKRQIQQNCKCKEELEQLNIRISVKQIQYQDKLLEHRINDAEYKNTIAELKKDMEADQQSYAKRIAELQNLNRVLNQKQNKDSIQLFEKADDYKNEISQLKYNMQANKRNYVRKQEEFQIEKRQLQDQITKLGSQKQNIKQELSSKNTQLQKNIQRYQFQLFSQKKKLSQSQQQLNARLNVRIQSLLTNLETKKRQVNSLAIKQTELNAIIEKTTAENKLLKERQGHQAAQNQKLKIQIQTLNAKLQQIQNLNRLQKIQLKQLAITRAQLGSKSSQLDILVLQLQQKEVQYSQLQTNLLQTKQKLRKEIKYIQNELNLAVTKEKRLREQKENMQKKISQLQQERKIIKVLQKKIEALQAELLQTKAKLNQTVESNRLIAQSLNQNQKKIKKIMSENYKLQQQIKKVNSKMTLIQIQKDQITTEKNKYYQQYLKIVQKYQLSENENKKAKKYLEEKLKLKQQTIDKLQCQLRRNSQGAIDISKLPLNLLNYYKSTQQPQRRIPPFHLLMIDRLFQGELLQDHVNHKQTIVASLQKLQHKTIRRSKLIYKYDCKNAVSFHDYIDGTRQMLLIVKSSKGTFLAAYNSGQYNQKIAMTGPGLLISLRTGQSFELYAQSSNKRYVCRAMTYDKFYLNFGNSQVRMKWTDTKKPELFSNFGVSNSYFNNRESKVDSLLGQGDNRDTTFEAFELYQIQYHQQSFLKNENESSQSIRNTF